MDIINKQAYNNSVYIAVVVNSNSDDDPNNEHRIQIYIPEFQYEYDNEYQEYVKDSNKTDSKYKDKFPWAKSLVKDLKNGHIVYGSFIYNETSSFIILGKDEYNPTNLAIDGENNEDTAITETTLLDLAMAIILYNEVSLPLGSDYTKISDSHFGNINCNDNGSLSIGLLQWHETRATGLLIDISEADNNWKSYWSDKSLSSYNAILNKTTSFGPNWILTKGNNEYNAIQKMLTSNEGKKVQYEKARADTLSNIKKLMGTYSLSNPAMIIYCADIMNQWGSYVNNRSPVTGCMDEAKKIDAKDKDYMDEMDEFSKWWKARTSE